MSTPPTFMVLAAGAGSFAPSSIPNMQGWWDFTDPAQLYTDAGTTLVSADGQAIYRVNDKSGTGHYLEQATVGARPLYKTAIVNGLSVARFDGINDVIGLAVPVAVTGSYLIVVKKRSAPGGSAQDAWTRSAGGAELLTLSSWSATDWVWYKNQAGAQVALTGATATNWAIVSVVHTSASAALAYYNGTQVGSLDPDDTLTSGPIVNMGGGNFGDIDVAVMFYFNVALSAANHNALGSYLAFRFGLTWATVP